MSDAARVLAVDLGASSVRVAAIDLAASSPTVEVVHRWQHAPVESGDGSLRWDWPRLIDEVRQGLSAGRASGSVASIGVDGWAVDYGLLDGSGTLISPPYSYRDARTDGWREIAGRIGVERLYGISGVQLMGLNTIFQLAVHDRDEIGRAERLMLLPDLVVRSLTGFDGAERSNASTTGLFDTRSGDWSDELISAIGLERSLFPPIEQAGRRVGVWDDIPVHLVGSHDTASAFLGMPGGGEPGTVFVSTGTWVIVGAERSSADTSAAALEANFSNEAGAMGGIRFLKNVIGFWMLEQCRPAWGNPPVESLLEEAEAVDDPVPVFDARDPRFLHPADMEHEIRAAAGIAASAPRGTVVRSILESIALGIAGVVDELGAMSPGARPTEVAIVGGGVHVSLLHRMIGRHTGLPVVVGSPEATALGNAIVQGVALGHFSDLAEARDWLQATGRMVAAG